MKFIFRTLFILIFIITCNDVLSQKFEPVKEIPEGKALVYIYRPGSMVGAAVHYTVNANNEKVSEAHLKNKTYLVYFAEPGKYRFWGQVTNTMREINLEVEAGKTYYIRGNCCEFIIPSEEDAKNEIVKCKLSTL